MSIKIVFLIKFKVNLIFIHLKNFPLNPNKNANANPPVEGSL